MAFLLLHISPFFSPSCAGHSLVRTSCSVHSPSADVILKVLSHLFAIHQINCVLSLSFPALACMWPCARPRPASYRWLKGLKKDSRADFVGIACATTSRIFAPWRLLPEPGAGAPCVQTSLSVKPWTLFHLISRLISRLPKKIPDSNGLVYPTTSSSFIRVLYYCTCSPTLPLLLLLPLLLPLLLLLNGN